LNLRLAFRLAALAFLPFLILFSAVSMVYFFLIFFYGFGPFVVVIIMVDLVATN